MRVPSLARAAACALLCAVASAQNVLVIMVDDVGTDLLGCYETHFRSLGQPPGTPADTPAIDTLLAGRGLMFTNAYGATICTPGRARLLTGRYGFRTGIGSVLKHTEVPPLRNPGLSYSQTLLPELLHVAPTSYTCVALGKWHLVDIEQVVNEPLHALGSPPGRWFDRFAGSNYYLLNPQGTITTNTYSNWQKHFATFVSASVNPCAPGYPPCDVALLDPPIENYATVDTTDDALTSIAELPQPWFLYVNYNAVHTPEHLVPLGPPTASCGSYTPPATPCDPGNPATDASRVRCMMRALDDQIGRLLCGVNTANTTIVFLSDNGTFGDAILPPFPANHGKSTVYDLGTRLPLIICSPTQAPATVGAVCDALVSTTDLFATIAEIAQVPPALITAEDSLSLVPYLTGSTVSARRSVYTESFLPNFVPEPAPGWLPVGYEANKHVQALRDRRFKLIRRWTRDTHSSTTIAVTEEFYDLLRGGPPDISVYPPVPTRDWFEQNDLLASGLPLNPVAARTLVRLRAELDQDYPTVVQ